MPRLSALRFRLPVPALGLAVLLASSLASAQPVDTQQAPAAPGRYQGRLCVTPLDAPEPSASEMLSDTSACGPAELLLTRGGQLRVQVSDIVYRLQLGGAQLGVVLTQGSMQLDGFVSPYRWVGSRLRFEDAEKGMRYAVLLGPTR